MFDELLRYAPFAGWSPTLVQENNAPVNVDLLNTGGDARDELWLNVMVLAAVESGGTATVQFKLKSDTDDAFGTEVVGYTGVAIPKATLVAGYGFSVRIPRGMSRYTRASATIAVAALTAGTFFLGLSDHPEYMVRNQTL